MLHKNRNWSLQEVDSIDKLACMLAEFQWPLCQAMQLGSSYIVANDSVSMQGLQEYAMLRRSAEDSRWLVEVDRITVCPCSEADVKAILQKMANGHCDLHDLGRIQSNRFASIEQHGYCPLCV